MALRGIELTPIEAESTVMSQQDQAAADRVDLTWMRTQSMEECFATPLNR